MNNVGIYDGLFFISKAMDLYHQKIQKKEITSLKCLELKSEISSNLKIEIYFDVTLNLSTNSYEPFSKSNAITKYINITSNFPVFIIKSIPNVINIKINRLSSSKTYLMTIMNSTIKLYIIAVIKIILNI